MAQKKKTLVRKTSKRTKKLPTRSSRITLRNLLIFAIIFAIIGGYIIWRSFAASALILTATNLDTTKSTGAAVVTESGSQSKRNSQVVQLTNTSSSNAQAVFVNGQQPLDAGIYQVCLYGFVPSGTVSGTLQIQSDQNGTLGASLGSAGYTASQTSDYATINCASVTSQSANTVVAVTVTNQTANAAIRIGNISLKKIANIPPPPPPPSSADAAHLSRSINVSGYNAADQFVTNSSLQNIIGSHSIPYLRVPFRDGWTDAQYTAMLQAVQTAKAVPLVIVHGNCANLQSTDDHWLTLVDHVFTSGPYYVEYGNEEDLSCNGGAGIGATVYTTGWNRDIPVLKANHPRALFMGPVNYQYNGPYIQTFLQTANPRPDVISWHEYVCSSTTADATCLNNIAHWGTHAADMQSRMNTVGYHVPVWITEWNMDPQDEARYQTSFIQTWTSQALNEWSTLIGNNQINVALIYTMASHGNFNGSCSGFQLFCSNNSLTPQGQTFFSGI